MVNKLITGFATVALAVAAAASGYKVTIFNPVVLNGATLQPGGYTLQVNENTVTLTQGKTVVEAKVKVENSSVKFSDTSLKLNGKDLEEIRLGGTHTRLIFEKTGTATN
jgi:hypothetical protein